jgi:phosphatidylinositol glycan class N
VQAIGYIHREVLTVLFILGAFWPATYGITFLNKHKVLASGWFASCLAMSIFTLLPAMKEENITLM